MKEELNKIINVLVEQNAIGPDFKNILLESFSDEEIYIYMCFKFLGYSKKTLSLKASELKIMNVEKCILKIDNFIDEYCGLEYFEEICKKNKDCIENDVSINTTLIGRM